jgi:hypothetical protein
MPDATEPADLVFAAAALREPAERDPTVLGQILLDAPPEVRERLAELLERIAARPSPQEPSDPPPPRPK